MGKYEDFDLDLKQIKNRGTDIAAAFTEGYICSKVIDTIIDTIIKSIKKSVEENCSEGCPVPSIDYQYL